jgi:hypothetical protein
MLTSASPGDNPAAPVGVVGAGTSICAPLQVP